jgi:hypothetical protein
MILLVSILIPFRLVREVETVNPLL